jgi:hypothetical protein
MRQHTVEIGDSQGHAFKMLIWTPSAWTKVKFWNSSDRYYDGDWRAIEKGYIRFNSGDAIRRYNGDGETGADLYLYVPDEKDKGNAGIILSKYDDWSGTNDEGAGELFVRAKPPWGLILTPGPLTWSLVD